MTPLVLEPLEPRTVPAFFGFWPTPELPSLGPVAVDDVASGRKNAAFSIEVLANDFVEGTTLDPGSVRVATQPASGRVSLDPVTGVLVYFPGAGSEEQDQFQYTVTDVFGRVSNVATVTLMLGDGAYPPGQLIPPTPDFAVTSSEVAVTIPVLANDDPGSGNSYVPGSVTVTVGPRNGTVTIDPVSGAATYTPSFGHIGPDSFKYTALTATGVLSEPTDVLIDVRPAAPQLRADPAGGQMLVVYGTGDGDKIQLTSASGGGFSLRINGQAQGTYGPVSRVIVFAAAGDDQVTIAEAVTAPVWVYGGAGSDEIAGGGGDNVFLGGGGNDRIRGGRGRDILIGGAGSDWLIGGGGDDLLIGGTTSFDEPGTADQLLAVFREWTSNRTYAERVTNLGGTGSGVRANGTTFLMPGLTVSNDAAPDRLDGGTNLDWFLYDPTLDRSDLDEDGEACTVVG